MDYKIIDSFHCGHCVDAYKVFGAHFEEEGVRFTLWAPHARKVSIIGSFNNWDNEGFEMERITNGGIYSVVIPNVKKDDMYKYRIVDNKGNIF